MATVSLLDVSKTYEGGIEAVRNASLEIHDGEFVVLVGPSGCGKSTILRMIAGLEPITDGEVHIDGRRVNDISPRDRNVAMVFQNYALYPHMTVEQNLGFGLKLRKYSKSDIRRLVHDAADVLGIEDILGRKPAELSGGQRQRVAVGRAIVREPDVFLFDEPLSNLDARLRVQMRMEISRLHRRLGTTMIYVTHDQVEAMTMGDRIVVLNRGDIQQVDSPQTLYDRPLNRFVGTFIGSPAMNLFSGTLVADIPLRFEADDRDLSCTFSGDRFEWLRPFAGRRIDLGIRPEHVRPSEADRIGPDTIQSNFQLEIVEPMGSEMVLYARREGQSLVARFSSDTVPRQGTDISLSMDVGKAHFFDAETGLNLRTSTISEENFR